MTGYNKFEVKDLTSNPPAEIKSAGLLDKKGQAPPHRPLVPTHPRFHALHGHSCLRQAANVASSTPRRLSRAEVDAMLKRLSAPRRSRPENCPRSSEVSSKAGPSSAQIALFPPG
ncbi:unnamed protein product [Cylicocyclus nassatus]|uniref:Uncharacterized protein n=1 Tax=Cylicocyclus nassatus TaxID=53992 RepID=A0AA36HHR3_CYLNA|nr:unnamed protein product [Cylicocyclus nassatus]